MEWSQLLSSDRPTAVKRAKEPGRTHFHKDYDRIVFSAAFRRLGRKTQVHAIPQNDMVRSRLTHSIEVASVGRTLGTRVAEGLREQLPSGVRAADLGTLVQAACLAHDIGNPPFGHQGEFIIRDWVRENLQPLIGHGLSSDEYADLANFEGNAQGFRLLTRSDEYSSGSGLGLTAATLGAMIKYPWTSTHLDHKPKFGIYQSEKAIMNQVAESTGLKEIKTGSWQRHPLSYLVEAADDICYALLDLEDGVEVGSLEESAVKPLFLQLATASDKGVDPTSNLPQLRGKAMAAIISEVCSCFIYHHDEFLAGEVSGDLLGLCNRRFSGGVYQAKSLAQERIFSERNKANREQQLTRSLTCLLDAMFTPILSPLLSSSQMEIPAFKKLFANIQASQGAGLYICSMMIIDFLASMTDNYVLKVCKELGMEGVWE